MIQTLRKAGRPVRLDLTDPDDHISRRIIRFRDFYERDLLDDLRSRARAGLALDVGAHIGNHSVFMAAICGLDVVAFEPNPKTRTQLERNVALNELSRKVRVVAAAAGRQDGYGRLEALRENNSGMTRCIPDPAGDVPVVSIDSAEYQDVSVIKIDVEGAELDILEGARRTLERCRPILYVEADGDERRDRLDAWMRDHGYERFGCYALTPTYGYAPIAQPLDASQVRLSTAIMAHPKRAAFVADLQAQLAGDVEVVWDEANDRWDTGRRALLAYDRDATHHLVIQDDAVVCRDLLAGVAQALRRNPHGPMSLYLGRQRPHAKHFQLVMQQALAAGARYIIGPELCWGVALVFPTSLIDEMVANGDARSHVANYDSRLAKYLLEQKIPTWYTVPSLVDHRRQEDSPSLVPGRTGANRVAREFLGADRSALEFDWVGGIIAVDRRPARPMPVACPMCGSHGFACGTAASPEPLIEVGV